MVIYLMEKVHGFMKRKVCCIGEFFILSNFPKSFFFMGVCVDNFNKVLVSPSATLLMKVWVGK